MDSEARGIEQQAHIAELLAQAQAAYENDDSQSVANLCREVLDVDPDNAQAWLLLAKFGGWDSKLYGFDVGFAIDAAKHALELVPETTRRIPRRNSCTGPWGSGSGCSWKSPILR